LHASSGFTPNLIHAWISRWLEGEKVESFLVRKLSYSLAFEIPRTALKRMKSLLKSFKNEKGSDKVKDSKLKIHEDSTFPAVLEQGNLCLQTDAVHAHTTQIIHAEI